MSLIMTLLVRDEEDILRANLDYHLAKGVDHVIVTDNLSVDSTPDIIDDYVRQKVATYIHEPDDTYSQSRWVSRMAHMAATEFRAKWVMHSDADEFWMTPDCGSLKRYFGRVWFHNVVEAPRHDFVCLEDDGQPFWKRMVYRQTMSLNPLGKPLPPKVAHKARPGLVVAQGNHSVSGFRRARKLRGGIEILHFPLRSRSQYIRKIENGGRAYEQNTELPKSVGNTWRKQYAELKETGTLAFVDENTVSQQEVDEGLARNELRLDTRLRDFFGARP